METELIERQESPVANVKKLLGSGLKVSELKEFMEMQIAWEKREAEKAYHVAMAEFKKEVPEILKNKHVRYETKQGNVVEYDHADLGDIVEALTPALAKHGLNATWNFEQKESVKVNCIITHKHGFSTINSLVAPPDTSGGKNSIQAVASTVKHLERYTLLGTLGLSEKGSDDDGRSAEGAQPQEETELTPKSQNWKLAKNAYMRDGNLKIVLEKSKVNEENQKLLIYECAREVFEQWGNFDNIANHEGFTEEIKNRIIDEER